MARIRSSSMDPDGEQREDKGRAESLFDWQTEVIDLHRQRGVLRADLESEIDTLWSGIKDILETLRSWEMESQEKGRKGRENWEWEEQPCWHGQLEGGREERGGHLSRRGDTDGLQSGGRREM